MSKNFGKMGYVVFLSLFKVASTDVRAQDLVSETATLDTTPTHAVQPTASDQGDSDILAGRVAQTPAPQPTAKDIATAQLESAYEILSHELAVKHILFPHAAKKSIAALTAQIGNLRAMMDQVAALPDPVADKPLPVVPKVSAPAELTGSYADKLKTYFTRCAEQEHQDAEDERLAWNRSQQRPQAPYAQVQLASSLGEVQSRIRNSLSPASYNSTTSQQRINEAFNDIEEARKALTKAPTPAAVPTPVVAKVQPDTALDSLTPQTALQLEVLRGAVPDARLSKRGLQAYSKIMLSTPYAFNYPQEIPGAVKQLATPTDEAASGAFENMLNSHPKEALAAARDLIAKNKATGGSYGLATRALTAALTPALIKRVGNADAEDTLVSLMFQPDTYGSARVVLALEGKSLMPQTLKKIKELLAQPDVTPGVPVKVISALLQ